MLVKSFTGQALLNILNTVPDEYKDYPLFVNWGYNELSQYFIFMGVSNVKVKRIDNKGVVGSGVYGTYDDYVKDNAVVYERPCLFFGESDVCGFEDSTPNVLIKQLTLITNSKYLPLPICMIVNCDDYRHGSFLSNIGIYLSNVKLGLGLFDLNYKGAKTDSPNYVRYKRNEYLVLEILNDDLTCGEMWSNNRDYEQSEIIPIYSLDDPKYCTPYTDLYTWLSYHPQYKLVNKIEDAKIIFTSNIYVNDPCIIALNKEIKQYDN